ncbi:MAG: cupin domain-containing protein [Phycisphaeraceae bacterium]
MSTPHTHTDQTKPIGLIGGIGLTEVHVYSQRPAPDGLFSGCPHVHAVTDEGYFVLEGSGAVEFHDLTLGYRKMPLERGQYVHFPPLVMHRIISDGELVILGMMGNAGLAESGEARIYFGPGVDEDAEAFAWCVGLPKAKGLEGALQRRDMAVEGYLGLMRLWETDRDAYFKELKRFFDMHCRAMHAIAGTLVDRVVRGPMAWAQATLSRIEALPGGPRVEPLVKLSRRGSESAFGMCGVLRPITSLETFGMGGSAAETPA